MTDRTIYHFTGQGRARARIDRVNVNDPRKHVQSPYELVAVRPDGMEWTLGFMNRHDLANLRWAITEELGDRT